MSRFLIISFVVSLLTFAAPQDNSPVAERVTDARTGKSIVRSKSIPISGPKDRYHSLAFSMSYPLGEDMLARPKTVKFELVSVVKARRLNSDLYVVFVIDGKEIHFSSNRSAIRKPVPGKPWIGERMVFQLPYEEFHKMVEAKTLSVKLGGVTFDFPDNARRAMGALDFSIRQPTA
ncbi:MAG TPA: hypothetical protein VFM63_02070 [Pyrinomonadaceae bacterium]|nr:hypothetical protein [Pyrinomonadaceae bacterium]